MYVFMHERCQLYDLSIKWSSEREIIPLKIYLKVTSFILKLVKKEQQM